MADWKKVVLATGTSSQYIKGDGSFATDTDSLPLTGGQISGNLGIGVSPSSKLHINVGTDQNLEVTSVSSKLHLMGTNDARNANIPLTLGFTEYDFEGASGSTIRLKSTNSNITGAELVGKVEAYISDASGNLPGVAGSIDWTTSGSIDGGSSKGTTLTLKNYLESAGLQTVLTIDKDKLATFAGNVGIGLSNPSDYYATQLVVSAPDNGGMTFVSGNTAHASGIFFADGTDSSAYRGQMVYDHDDDSFGIWTGATNALMIDSSQNVGIGTTAPADTLHLENGNSTKIRFSYGSGNYINQIANEWDSGTVANNKMRFFVSTGHVSNTVEPLTLAGNGRVGIGTNNPLNVLHVESDQSSNWLARFKNTGTTNAYGIYVDTTANTSVGEISLGVYTGLGTGFFVTSDSKVGIGTIAPDSQFHLHGSTGIRLTDSNQNANEYAEIKYDNGGVTNLYINNDWTGSNALINFQLAGSTKMVVRGDGNVGIGTTNPSQLLTLNGGSMYMNTGQGITWNNGDAQIGAISGYHFQIKTYDGSALTEKMRITSSGNVGIGTSSPNISGGASGSKILTISATDSEKNALIELKGTRGSSGAFNSYIRSFSNSGATPITDIVSKRGASDTAGSLELYTSNAVALTLGTDQSATFSGNITSNSGNGNKGIVSLATSGDNAVIDLNNGTPSHVVRIHAGGDTFFNGGNVGIGTSSPDATGFDKVLHIEGGSTSIVRFTGTTYSNDGGYVGLNYGGIELWNKRNAYMRFGTNNTERFRIQADGSVGIGTASPDTKLQIRGDFDGSSGFPNTNPNKGLNISKYTGTASDYGNNDKFGITFTSASNADTDYAIAGIYGQVSGVSSYVGGHIVFASRLETESALSEKMVITSSGNVSIGMPVAHMSKTLHVQSNTGSASTPNGLMLTNTIHGSDSQIYMYAENDSGSSSSGAIKYDPDAMYMWLQGSSGKGLYINHSGNTVFSENTHHLDSKKLFLGSSSDAELYSDGSNTYFTNNVSGQDMLFKVRVGSSLVQALKIDGGTGDLEIGYNTHLGSGKSINFTPTVYSSDVQGIKFDSASYTNDAIIQPVLLGSTGTALFIGSNCYVNTSGSLARYNTGEESSFIQVRPEGQITFGTSGTGANPSTRMTIDSSGNIGIGTASPSASHALTIAGDLQLTEAHPAINFTDSDDNTDSRIYHSAGGLYIDADNNNESSSSLLRFSVGDVEAMRIDENQNIGIGVTPEADWLSTRTALQIGGSGAIFGATSAGAGGTLNIGQNVYFHSGGSYRRIDEDEVSMYTQKDGTHQFKVAGSSTDNSTISFTNVLTIINSGNVGIGTTQPDKKLHVASSDDVLATFESTDTHATIRLIDVDTTNEATLTRVEDDLEIVKNGGNVSIGKDNPTQALDVNGSIISSGVLLAPTYATFIHSFTDELDTVGHYLPWNSSAETTGNDFSSTSFVVPMSMKLAKLFIRIENIANVGNHNLTVTLISKADGTITNTTVASATKAFNSTNNNKTVTYQESDFSAEPKLSQNQMGSIKLQFATDIGGSTDYFITSVWEMNNNTL